MRVKDKTISKKKSEQGGRAGESAACCCRVDCCVVRLPAVSSSKVFLLFLCVSGCCLEKVSFLECLVKYICVFRFVVVFSI